MWRGSEQRITYTLLKKTFDDRWVHHFVFVHLTDFGTDDILSKALNWSER